MFWKNVNFNKLNIGSIRVRLTLLYTTTAFILLFIIAACLYWETVNILYKADYQFLSDEVDTIQYILNNKKADISALKKLTIDIPRDTDKSIYRYFVRVVDTKEKVIAESPGIERILLNKQVDNAGNQLPNKKRYWWYGANGNNYLLIKAPLTSSLNKQLGSVIIALDVSHQHFVLSDRKLLLMCFGAIILFALFLGFYISHKGLQSLYVLTETTKKMTASSLYQRIDPQSWPYELRELGIAYNQMLERIQASFLRLKQFSSDLAHELRTPINNLIGQSEITLSYSQSVDEYQNVLGSNLEELHRISHLIENILFLARAENPELVLQKKELNLYNEVAVVCEYYQAMAEEKNISVSYEGAGTLNADSIMIRRMISNILSNSLNYTNTGGWIHFSINEVDSERVQIIARDNGIGISAEHLPKLFDRFYRVDSARAKSSGGIGLGLAIVKSIVDLHKGTLSVVSAPMKGTTLSFTFPK